MITGLLCPVQGDELINHCQKRTALSIAVHNDFVRIMVS
jgi:hypothetical protein